MEARIKRVSNGYVVWFGDGRLAAVKDNVEEVYPSEAGALDSVREFFVSGNLPTPASD